ncbi:MAG: S9 family peptidase [Acidobacteria bacterium]|nr:S9 family peptidase [Acidobacteriota bacterium]
MTFARRRITTALFFCAIAASAFSQEVARPSGNPRIGQLLEHLGKTRTPTTAAISSDGKTVAWSVRGSRGDEIHLTDLASGADKALETGSTAPCSSASPTWSPDGDSLAYLSTCGAETKGQGQVFLWSKKTGQSKQLTHLTGAITSPAWSPDGKTIAFLFVENATRAAGALAAMKPWNGVIGEDGVEIQGVYRIDVTSERGKWFVPPTQKMHVYEFSWAPDSKRIAFIGAPAPGENNWWVARLYTAEIIDFSHCSDGICLSNGGGLREYQVLDPATTPGPLHGLQIALPRFSPDGKQIAFIGGLMSDQGSTGGDIWVVPATGGEPKNLTPERKATPAYFTWIDDNKLAISEHVGGSSHLTDFDLKTGKNTGVDVTFPESIGSGASVMSVSTARNSDIAIIRSSFERAPEVWAGRDTHLKQITHLNDSLKPLWGKTENVEWTNEGFHVQGWLLYPANYDPSKKYPLIVSVHGGPSSAVSPRWPGVGYGGVPFSALGYFVFMPNPRGSYGQGEKFTQANIKDFGYGDLRDITAGMDTIEARLPIDKTREGLTGWSYGGFMTMFAVTQTTRFHAAVAGAGISNWKSYYGENSIDQWMIPFFGASVYDDPAVYAKSSAIEYIKNVKTPTLVVVGDRDGECPAPQSFEFWHALRAQGVKTQLVVYPNEGHAFRSPEHRRDVLERALNWFEGEMPAK